MPFPGIVYLFEFENCGDGLGLGWVTYRKVTFIYKQYVKVLELLVLEGHGSEEMGEYS